MGNNPSTSSPASPTSVTSSPVPNPPPPVSTVNTPPIIVATTQEDLLKSAPGDSQKDMNPGTYEQLHQKCKELFPMVFEGGKLVIGKGLSSHFQINHTLTLATPQTSGYRFGATYVGSKQFGPQESYPILLGDINANGDLNANVIHGFSKNIISRFVAQFQGDKCNTQMVTDIKGNSYTGSVTIANPDIVNSSGLVVSQYLQRVTPSLDLGAECMYQCGGHIPGGQIAVLSLAGRLQGEKWQLSSTLCPSSPTGGGFHACYYQRVNETLQIGAEMDTSIGMGESSASVVYQLEVPSAGVLFKALCWTSRTSNRGVMVLDLGQFDTNWNVQATMEKKLMESQIPFTFIMSALGNQAKSDYKFGVGMMLG